MDINAPVFPESIADGEVATWHVAVGQWVARDQILVDIETDKVVLEVVAPSAGRLTKILKAVGAVVGSEECLAEFEAGENETEGSADGAGQDADENQASSASSTTSSSAAAMTPSASPSARKLAEESSIVLASIVGTGKNGLINKEDVLQAVARAQQIGSENPISVATNMTVSAGVDRAASGDRIERRVPMTRLRASIAKRLVEAQQNAAMLTTFNEVDMTAIMSLRKQYKKAFQKAHNGTRLGFMSFFVKACTEALKRFPGVNASIDGKDIVYHDYFDVGIAVSSERGLVVPILRDVDDMSYADIELAIRGMSEKARDGKLGIDDLTGGTFSITNGGVFGSMLSTPILNPPQSAIMGMHNIQQRAVVVDGEIVIRPIMNLALSYDHRLIDGKDAVRFLVAIKQLIEDPAKILLEI